LNICTSAAPERIVSMPAVGGHTVWVSVLSCVPKSPPAREGAYFVVACETLVVRLHSKEGPTQEGGCDFHVRLLQATAGFTSVRARADLLALGSSYSPRLPGAPDRTAYLEFERV
jgi:hypothetical protein